MSKVVVVCLCNLHANICIELKKSPSECVMQEKEERANNKYIWSRGTGQAHLLLYDSRLSDEAAESKRRTSFLHIHKMELGPLLSHMQCMRR